VADNFVILVSSIGICGVQDMPEPECPFCLIQSSAEEEGILFKGQHVFVILSSPRLMEGHLLVIPKIHVSELSALTADETGELFGVAIGFQKRLKELFQSGCDLSQHDRPFMPTTRLTVPHHLHIHLKPRTWKDEYYEKVQQYETDLFKDLSSEERGRLWGLLKA